MRITWLGHASVLVETKSHTIYIDPYFDPYAKLRLPKATVVLITHWHPDHVTRESVERVNVDATRIFGTKEAASEFYNCTAMNAGQTQTVGDLIIKAMPAQTTDHIGGHDQEGFVLGFWIESEGKKLYYTSDTDLLPNMQGLKPNIVLIPVGGTTTMNAEEAAKAVQEIGAPLAVPTHWGSKTGTRDDAELFKEYLEKTHKHQAVILTPGEMIDI